MPERDISQKDARPEVLATRRGFLFDLLGNLAGAAALLASAAKPGNAALAGGDAAPGKAGTPIDNIFVPIRSSKGKTREEQL